MKRLVGLIPVLLLAALACSFSPENLGLPEGITDPELLGTTVAKTLAAAGEQAIGLATSVAETQQALTAPTADLANTGTAEVSLCFPSEMIPIMTLYLVNVNTQAVTAIPTIENQPPMSIPLPAGTYTAYAWLPDFVYGGSYSQSVPCGLSVNCTDHSLIEFQITPGQVTSGIDVCDWYGNGSDVPFPPGVDLSPYFGAITGNLGYPSESIPPMTVVAANTTTQQFYFIETSLNQGNYIIENLPPGHYQIVAYPQGEEEGGGYSQFVPCGQTVSCTDHSLIPVQVTAGQTASGADPVDFYAGPGAFPPNPTN